MIRSFASPDTQRFFEGARVPKFVNFAATAERKLTMLNAAVVLDDLKSPPGNRLEALSRDRAGQHSINDQSRICLVWSDKGPERVEIVDYC